MKECPKIRDKISFVWLSNDDRIIIGFISSGKLMFVSVKLLFNYIFVFRRRFEEQLSGYLKLTALNLVVENVVPYCPVDFVLVFYFG